MVFFENCFFKANTANANPSWIQGYYGCRIVIRYCTFDYVSVDMHGTAGNKGARWWEGYRNTFTNASGDNQTWAFSMRAGSGVLYNNTNVGAVAVDIGLCEEDSGYPATYQIGRGKDQALDPAYVWDNGSNMTLSLNECDAPEQANMVQLNRDVFASAKSGYTAFTYPHPARGEAQGGGDVVSYRNKGKSVAKGFGPVF